MEEKRAHAQATRKLYDEKRETLIDNVEGTAHKLYGSMPNMTYVIAKDGTVKFRANWTNIDALKEVLLTITTDKIEEKAYFEATKPSPFIAIRTLLIGGVGALFEFLTSLPQLMRQHKEAQEKR